MQLFFEDLKKQGIYLKLSGDKLKIVTKLDKVPADILISIKERKTKIIEFLSIGANSFDDIPKVEEQSCYPLSSSQKRLWVLSQFENGSIAYNISKVVKIVGKLDVPRLKQAFEMLVERHEVLRTTFDIDNNGEIKQFIKEKIDLKFKQLDLKQEASDEIDAVLKKEKETPFDFKEGPLLRICVISVAKNEFVLCCVIHHIISDGWSINVLVSDLLSYYDCLLKNTKVELEPLAIQYKDFACWQSSQIEKNELLNSKSFWNKQFADKPEKFKLFTDYARQPLKSFNGSIESVEISKATIDKFKKYLLEKECTLYMGLLGVIKTLLFNYSNQEDIVIGIPTTGRENIKLENQIGFYVNTLPIRTQINSKENFGVLVESIRSQVLGAFSNQYYPFEELIEDLNLDRDLTQNPLFDVLVSYNDFDPTQYYKQRTDFQIEEYVTDSDVFSVFDLVYGFSDRGDDVLYSITYNTDLYKSETIDSMLHHFEELINSIIDSPNCSLEDLEYLLEKEKKILLEDFNNTKVEFDLNSSIVKLFEEQVLKCPDKTAVVFEDISINYLQLNEISNKFANYLTNNHKIRTDDLIAIQLPRTEWMIIAILGVLKSGAAFVPIDDSYPQKRIDFIVSDSNASFLIDENFLANFKKKLDTLDSANINVYTQPTDLVYSIYTSGSTGRPKGVLIEQKSILNTIYSQIEAFSISNTSNVLQFASFSFDAFISELFTSLLSTACLHVLNEETRKDPSALSEYILSNEIDVATIPPSLYVHIEEGILQQLKVLISAGEKANKPKFQNLDNCLNAYGPTETSICATIYDGAVEANANTVPIGKPISNTQVYILNRRNKLLPIGAIGEICIGGLGLARGYQNRPELTKDKFVSNPFDPNQRMYKTGDLGRWLHDGNIEFIGRVDDQIKIRGYRIEVNEIEQCMLEHESVDSAVLLVKQDDLQNDYLALYFTASKELTSKELSTFVSLSLPKYMVPNVFYQLEQMPITSNGKIDKKTLLALTDTNVKTGVAYVAPRNKTEEKLVSIWAKILEIEKDKIGVHDNFFSLGGHSLRAIKALNATNSSFNISLQLSDMFKITTIEELSELIQTIKGVTDAASNANEYKHKITF